MDIDLSTLSQPWVSIDGEGSGFVSELRKEMTLGHVLYGKENIKAVARREDCDDVLFLLDDILALVHLTYSGVEADPIWPHTVLFRSWSEFLSERMSVDAAEFEAGVA